MNILRLGDAALERSRAVPRARVVDTRVTEDGGAEESFVQPLVVPKTPQRFYFKFGKPVTTKGLYEAGFMKDEEVGWLPKDTHEYHRIPRLCTRSYVTYLVRVLMH